MAQGSTSVKVLHVPQRMIRRRNEETLWTAWSRAEVTFLRAFDGKVPIDMNAQPDGQITVPFRLVKGKVIVQARVNRSQPMDFVLDTGSEQTTISRQTASSGNVRPITYTLSAGVGEVGLRGLQLGLQFLLLRSLLLDVLRLNPGDLAELHIVLCEFFKLLPELVEPLAWTPSFSMVSVSRFPVGRRLLAV